MRWSPRNSCSGAETCLADQGTLAEADLSDTVVSMDVPIIARFFRNGSVALAVALAVSLLAGACSSGDSDVATATTDGQSVTEVLTTVSGTALPGFDPAVRDLSIGMEAPTAAGGDLLTGRTVVAAADGKPLAIGFFAHWCPHCQRDVAELTGWLESNDLPTDVNFVAVSTFFDESRGNFPPAAWLEGEGWTHPVFSDTDDYAVAAVFGVPSIPFYVFVDSDGTVSTRLSGNLTPDRLVEEMEALN
jgi:thiol-disulfide isomerase/thioredoxin